MLGREVLPQFLLSSSPKLCGARVLPRWFSRLRRGILPCASHTAVEGRMRLLQDDEDAGTQDKEKEHERGAVDTTLLVFLLGLCIFIAYIIKKHRFYYVPESAGAMLVGCVVGGLIRACNPGEKELEFLRFDPEIFFFALLPPIIFEAGYTLRKKNFFANLATILMFAVGGTVVSTFVVGFLTWSCGNNNVIDIDSDPLEALLFGALISAVDPVATLSIMGSAELNCDPLLYSLVFGESVLNDAVAIVLFRIFLKYRKMRMRYADDEEGDAVVSENSLALAMTEFLGVSIGSVFCGVLIGLICSYLCKHTRISSYPHYEIAILFLFAYGSYALAELVSLSGIMSLFFSGITLSHYNSYNLSSTSRITSEVTFKALASVSEFFVYLYMGAGIFGNKYKDYDILFIVLAILFCNVGRLLNIFPFSFIANLFRQRQIPVRMQIVIWFAGLRGAIAFALAQNIPGEHTALYTTTTLAIVLFTTVVCGGLTEPLLGKMGMKLQHGSGSDPESSERYDSLVPNGGQSGLERRMSLADKVYTGFDGMWKQLDDLYMKPLFGGNTTRAYAERRREGREAEMPMLSSEEPNDSSEDPDDGENKATARESTYAPPEVPVA